MEDWIKDALFKSKEMKGLYPNEKAGHDGEYVKGSYEEHWGKKIQGLRGKMKKGESIAHMMAVLRTAPHLQTSYNRVGGQLAKHVLADFNETHDEKYPMTRLGMSEGRYVPMPNFDPLVHIKRKVADYKNIVELGAGPGWNLFDICVYLGTKVHQKKVFGLEYTDAGVEIINMLGEYENLPVKGFQFDYTQPDISMIPDDGPTLFYSHLSIEQVEDISRDLYDQLSKRKSRTTLIHVEPFGWQRYPELVKARMNNDDDFYRALIANRLDDLGGPHAAVMNAAINSWRVKYNRNALGHIFHMEKYGKLRIDHVHYDFTHNNNINAANPCSYVEATFRPERYPIEGVELSATEKARLAETKKREAEKQAAKEASDRKKKAAYAASQKAKLGSSPKKTAKKATTKKASAKKTTAKKTAARKTTTKKSS